MTPVGSSSLTTLESVKQKFDHWRATRVKRGKIPDALWKLVTPLMHEYNHTEISSMLSVNHSQLKKQFQQFPSISNETPPFVECSLPDTAPEIKNKMLEFISKNGTSVKISGMTTAEMIPIVSILMGS